MCFPFSSLLVKRMCSFAIPMQIVAGMKKFSQDVRRVKIFEPSLSHMEDLAIPEDIVLYQMLSFDSMLSNINDCFGNYTFGFDYIDEDGGVNTITKSVYNDDANMFAVLVGRKILNFHIKMSIYFIEIDDSKWNQGISFDALLDTIKEVDFHPEISVVLDTQRRSVFVAVLATNIDEARANVYFHTQGFIVKNTQIQNEFKDFIGYNDFEIVTTDIPIANVSSCDKMIYQVYPHTPYEILHLQRDDDFAIVCKYFRFMHMFDTPFYSPHEAQQPIVV